MAFVSKKTINLTVATQCEGNGGIASVLNVMKDGGFFERWNTVFLASHTQRWRYFGLNRQFLFAKTLLMLVYYHLFYNVNLVHVHMASRWSYLRKSYVIRLTKLLRGHVILHLHGGGFGDFYQNECNNNRQKKIRDVFNMSDRIIVLSTTSLVWAQGILANPEKAEIVYNAVPLFSSSNENTDSNLILFLGRLGQLKGVGDLINAFSSIAVEFPKARLVLGGDGDIDTYQKQVRCLALEGRVQFLGWITGETKLDWLRRAAIYVLPSYFEGFPMGVLEAMSANIPVIASNVGGIPEAITHEKEGLLIEAGNVDQIVEALRTLLSSQEKRDLYAEGAQEKVLKCFCPDVVFSRLDKIYASFCK